MKYTRVTVTFLHFIMYYFSQSRYIKSQKDITSIQGPRGIGITTTLSWDNNLGFLKKYRTDGAETLANYKMVNEFLTTI